MFKDRNKFLEIFYQKGMQDFEFSDCYGICRLFNKHVLGKNIPDMSKEDIYSDESISVLTNKTKTEFKKVSVGKERPGDLISFVIKGYPVHVGVVVEKGVMLHILEKKHASLESYQTNKWKLKTDSFWRYN